MAVRRPCGDCAEHLEGAPVTSTSGPWVLIVDDDIDARELLEAVVARQGVRTALAENGDDAMEKLRAADVKPFLILMDLQMPCSDGYDFRRAQLAEPALASIPTVVVSANYDQCDRDQLGDVEILPKPVRIDRIVELVKKHRAVDHVVS